MKVKLIFKDCPESYCNNAYKIDKKLFFHLLVHAICNFPFKSENS